jgi:hypothetical protein
MLDRAGPGLQVGRENRRHSDAYVEDFRGRHAGREQARRRQNLSVRALGPAQERSGSQVHARSPDWARLRWHR